jgi:hypothetical protein
MPNDWVYSMILEAFEDLEENGSTENCNVEADIYNNDLAKWFYENCNAYAHEYCNEGIELMGCETDILKMISHGQYVAKNNIYEAVENFIDEQARTE